MRTLKKSLCLVLALVFVLGLCTIGSNAANSIVTYSDAAQVYYEEAVEVLSGLGVIEGYPDGSFKPTADVTRAEAAAMIARMMLGREDADKLPIGDVKFTDVPETNWAAKYIAFCANKGIIVGMGDGTFHPSENVTGTQMATMLLRALGYGEMAEYEGKGWDVQAVADALYYGVFKDSTVADFDKDATREETALYVWNTMWIQLVGYDVDRNYYDGREYLDSANNWMPLNFAKKGFNLVKWDYAQLLANQDTGEEYTVIRIQTGRTPMVDSDGKEIIGRYNISWRTINLNTVTTLDLVGHEVTVYFKDELKEDKVNKCYYYEPFFIKDVSTVVAAGRDFLSYEDLYRVMKKANKDNVDVNFAYMEMWVNYDYTNPTTVGPAMDLDSFGYYYNISELKGQKSTNDGLAWILTKSTWILDHLGNIMLVLDTDYQLGKVTAIDDPNGELDVKVWRIDGYYYMPEYEYDADGNILEDENGEWVTVKDEKTGEDIEKAKYYPYQWYYRTPVTVYNENTRTYETEYSYYPSLFYIRGAYDADFNLLLKWHDTSKWDEDTYDQKFHDTSLIYDGIAKGDYVVVQPVGSLTYFKPTDTETVEITERSQGISGWSFNDGAYSADSNLGIPVDDTDDPAEVEVGDTVLFYTVKGAFSTTYFALQILEKANALGFVYLNYAAVVSEHTDWSLEPFIKVQVIDDQGEAHAYRMTVDAYEKIGGTVDYVVDEDDNKVPTYDPDTPNIKKEEVPVGLYAAKLKGKKIFLSVDTKALHEFTKYGGRNSFLRDYENYNTYYVTKDTTVIYFTGYGDDLEITVGNKLGDRDDGANYQVYAVSKKSGGTYKLQTVWANEDVVGTYSDQLMFIKASSGLKDDDGNTIYAHKPDGKNKAGKRNEVNYYTVYIDGVKATVHLSCKDKDVDDVYYGYEDEDGEWVSTSYVYEGYYEFTYDEDTDTYVISPVDRQWIGRNNERFYLSKDGDTVVYDKDDDAYYLISDFDDRIELTCEIKDISGGTTKGTKLDAAINSYERLAELIKRGYIIGVRFTYVWSDGNAVPTGIMYVVSVSSAGAED